MACCRSPTATGPALDDDQAYDGSAGPLQCPVAHDERSLLRCVIGMACGHPAWRDEQVVFRAVPGVGGGKRRQGCCLTAPERLSGRRVFRFCSYPERGPR